MTRTCIGMRTIFNYFSLRSNPRLVATLQLQHPVFILTSHSTFLHHLSCRRLFRVVLHTKRGMLLRTYSSVRTIILLVFHRRMPSNNGISFKKRFTTFLIRSTFPTIKVSLHPDLCKAWANLHSGGNPVILLT